MRLRSSEGAFRRWLPISRGFLCIAHFANGLVRIYHLYLLEAGLGTKILPNCRSRILSDQVTCATNHLSLSLLFSSLR